MREVVSLTEQSLMEQTPDYQPTTEDDLLELFRQYERGMPMYDQYIDEDSGGNYTAHASTRLTVELYEYIVDSGEAVSQWIRAACEARHREETRG